MRPVCPSVGRSIRRRLVGYPERVGYLDDCFAPEPVRRERSDTGTLRPAEAILERHCHAGLIINLQSRSA